MSRRSSQLANLRNHNSHGNCNAMLLLFQTQKIPCFSSNLLPLRDFEVVLFIFTTWVSGVLYCRSRPPNSGRHFAKYWRANLMFRLKRIVYFYCLQRKDHCSSQNWGRSHRLAPQVSATASEVKLSGLSVCLQIKSWF